MEPYSFFTNTMRRLLLSLTSLMCLAIYAADLPTTSSANSPIWYVIQFTKDLPVIQAQASGAEVKTARADESDSQAWRLEGNETDGYTFISRNGMTLYVNNDAKNSGFFYAGTSPNAYSRFDIVASTVSGSTDGFLLAPHGTSVYANQWQGSGVGKRIGLWDADPGCVIKFVKESDFDFSYQPAPPSVPEVNITSLGTAPAEPLTLWYKTPATNWTTQALPIGNGEMGGMVFGGIAQDRFQFNHKSFWRGGTGSNNLGTYLNFGELYIINNNAKASKNYQRRLDINSALAQVQYADATASYTREYLASYPDGVMAIRYEANAGTPLNVELRFINGYGERATYTTDGAIFSGTVNNGLNYRAEMRLQADDGEITTNKNGITLSNASAFTLYIVCGTDYDPLSAKYMTGDAPAIALQQTARLNAAVDKGYEAVRESHIDDYQKLFSRVDFQLSGAANNYQTPDLLTKTTTIAATKMVDMLVFQYGRYLTIASSRGIDLPSNLQGIWCKDGSATANATWASDIHTNINVQMNYWPAESTNLSECHEPLLNFIYNEAMRTGGGWQQNARSLGIQKGWVVNTASNIFGGSSSYKVGSYACANAWLCSHLWQHYAYTRDRQFLKEKALPVIKSACEFWFNRLKTGPDGSLECPHEYSPEQGRVQDATAHSQQLVAELFREMQCIIDELGDEANCNATFKTTLKNKMAKLDRGLRIDANGLLREWKYQENTPNQAADQNYFANDEQNVWKGHRHTSHLMGLYPFFDIDPGNDPAIFAAARASLVDRGDVATGWGRAWRISLWSRCRDAERTYKTLRGFAARTTSTNYDWHGGLYDNLMDAHATSVFQIEGNFGATAGIAEMLLQSRPDSLILLPTLPTKWPKGSIRGLKAIGNFEVSMDWENGKLQSAQFLSLAGQPLVLSYPGIGNGFITSDNDSPVLITRTDLNQVALNTTAGVTYTLRWEDADGIRFDNHHNNYSNQNKTSHASYDLLGRQANTSSNIVTISGHIKHIKK